MINKSRCPSKWNNILVTDDSGSVIELFGVDELGKLKTKLKTQQRRKIHERVGTKRTKDHQKTSIPKVNDESETTGTNQASVKSHPFDLGGFHDPVYPMFDIFQEFPEAISEINDVNEIDNTGDLYPVSEITEVNFFKEITEYNETNELMFFNEEYNMLENNFDDSTFIDF